MAYTTESFFSTIKPFVLQDMKASGILASLTASQAFVESNKGNSGLTKVANNLFGIKGSYNGQCVSMPTTEYYNGVPVRVYANFRKYPSWAESIADHSRLFNTSKRYTNLRGCTNYIEACKNVQADGYATSPTYAQTLIKCIETYKLNEWDLEVLDGDIKIPGQWEIGKNYVTQQDLNVRKTPNGELVQYADMTEDGKWHSIIGTSGNGILVRGTEVTVKDIQSTGTCTWLKIPSGWICGKNSKNIFVL